jgi:hypothetical protein
MLRSHHSQKKKEKTGKKEKRKQCITKPGQKTKGQFGSLFGPGFDSPQLHKIFRKIM